MPKLLKTYFDESIGHLVNVYKSPNRRHKQTCHSKRIHRMRSLSETSEKKKFDDEEHSLFKDVKNFVRRKELEDYGKFHKRTE
jgi:hypothetical protein